MSSRWSFLLLGGDMKDPAVRRMFWRIGGVAFVAGFFFGFLEPDAGESYSNGERYFLSALVTISFAVLGYEGWRFYRVSDELVRRVLIVSQAMSFCIVLVLMSLYGVAELLFGAPRPPVLVVALSAWVVSACCWLYAAWKST